MLVQLDKIKQEIWSSATKLNSEKSLAHTAYLYVQYQEYNNRGGRVSYFTMVLGYNTLPGS